MAPKLISENVPPARGLRLSKWLLRVGALVIVVTLAMPPSEQEWLETNSRWLNSVKITSEMISRAKEWSQKDSQWRYDLTSRKGVIPIGKDSGVYVVWHSFHDHETVGIPGRFLFSFICGNWQKPVRDAVLAVDQEGNFYRYDGHVCGGLTLLSEKEVNTIDDFLQTSDWLGKGWVRWLPTK